MNLRAVALSDVGLRRKTNEDSYMIAPEHGLYLGDEVLRQAKGTIVRAE